MRTFHNWTSHTLERWKTAPYICREMLRDKCRIHLIGLGIKILARPIARAFKHQFSTRTWMKWSARRRIFSSVPPAMIAHCECQCEMQSTRRARAPRHTLILTNDSHTPDFPFVWPSLVARAWATPKRWVFIFLRLCAALSSPNWWSLWNLILLTMSCASLSFVCVPARPDPAGTHSSSQTHVRTAHTHIPI